MRLCLIANYSIHTRRLVRYFVQQGHEVHLITIQSPQPPLIEGATVYDLTARINTRKLRFPIWGRHVRQVIRDMQPDILHAHQVSPSGWLGAAAGYHPFVVSSWGSDLLVGPRRSWLQRQLARWVLRSADYITCVSQNLADTAVALGADPNRLEVAPWGVDVDIFHPASDRQQLRARLGWEGGPLVLSVRSIKPVYNPLVIATAIPLVLQRIPSARFVVRTHLCDPALLARFQAIVEEGQAAGAVRYVGELSDERAIADQCRVADVALSVPSSDGTPSSVLEALACGAVPVVSDLPSLHEWVKHEQEVLFVPVGDAAALSQAIIRLLEDEELRGKMRECGTRLIRERADSRVWMQRNEEIYRRLIKG